MAVFESDTGELVKDQGGSRSSLFHVAEGKVCLYWDLCGQCSRYRSYMEHSKHPVLVLYAHLFYKNTLIKASKNALVIGPFYLLCNQIKGGKCWFFCGDLF